MAFSHKLEHEDGTPADPPTFGRLRKYVAPNLPHAYPGDTG